MTLSDKLYLCIDAGGTKVAAAIADARGSIIGRGRGGAANMSEVGVEFAALEVLRAVREAVHMCLGIGIAEGEQDDLSLYICPIVFEKATCGMSGCDTPVDATVMTARLQRHFSMPMGVINDGLLLSSPLLRHPSTAWAAAVVAGTGSIVIALTVDESGTAQQFAKRGGYGVLFGDNGSGYHLGLLAIRMASEDYDLGVEAPGGLAQALRETYGVASSDEVRGRAHDLEPDLDPVTAANERKLRISRLAPLVLSLAGSDPLATRVLRGCAHELARDIAVVVGQARSCGFVQPGGLVVTGGLGVQDAYLDVLVGELRGLGIEMAWVERMRNASEEGALALSKSANPSP